LIGNILHIHCERSSRYHAKIDQACVAKEHEKYAGSSKQQYKPNNIFVYKNYKRTFDPGLEKNDKQQGHNNDPVQKTHYFF
jgi:hypothetical protein